MRKLTIFLVVPLAALLAAAPAQAAGDSLTASYSGGGLCFAGSVSAGINGNYTWSNTRSWTSTATVNGAIVATGSGTLPAGPTSYGKDAGASFAGQSFPYIYQFSWTISGYQTITLTARCSSPGTAPIVTVTGGANNNPFWEPGDDRLNRDPNQPAALYCQNGNVEVWAINPTNGQGTPALEVTSADIKKVKDSKPAQNVLIKANPDGRFNLYYLPASDQLSFITANFDGKPYAYVWSGCQPG